MNIIGATPSAIQFGGYLANRKAKKAAEAQVQADAQAKQQQDVAKVNTAFSDLFETIKSDDVQISGVKKQRTGTLEQPTETTTATLKAGGRQYRVTAENKKGFKSVDRLEIVSPEGNQYSFSENSDWERTFTVAYADPDGSASLTEYSSSDNYGLSTAESIRNNLIWPLGQTVRKIAPGAAWSWLE